MATKAIQDMYDPKAIKLLRRLVDNITEEIDLDAVSNAFAADIEDAEEFLNRESKVRREDAFGDQSKW